MNTSIRNCTTGLFLFASMIAGAQTSSPCDPVIGKQCLSVVTDVIFNPYVTGAMGTWRVKKSFTFYEGRAESDPSIETNIRKDGGYAKFIPYWSFQQTKLKAATDTVRWVWNSEVTMFNKRGMELENRDPLGRYNAGLYGYNLSLPVAVVQNSRFRESAFEGFEDYHAASSSCTDNCPPSRHIDFSSYLSSMDSTEKHTGKRSLKVLPGNPAGVTVELSTVVKDTAHAKFTFQSKTGDCSGVVLNKITTDKNILLPNFSPTPGQKLLVSVWVKELQDCKCMTYQNNQVVVIINEPGQPASNLVMQPTGSIIEGWQRYEFPVQLPATATSFTISMRALGNATVFFDDLRIHPFNANMKSFVYHPVNLRLMAELDENNYASFYEYDDEGTLIRLKKETQRGIKTIKETRSSLTKQ